MNGIFRHKFILFWLRIAAISGASLAGLFLFILTTDDALTANDRSLCTVMIVLGALTTLLFLLSLWQTRKIFLQVEEDRIRGYIPLRGKVDCSMEDVDWVFWGGTGLTLTLKNDRSYNFDNLINNAEVGKLIRKRTFVPPQVSMDRTALARAILDQRKTANRKGICAILSLLLIFPPILLAAYLTDGRGLADFGSNDWQIFAAMSLTVLAGFCGFFLFLRSWVRANAKYERLLSSMLAQ